MTAFAYTLRLSRDFYFRADDWLLIRQSGSVRGLFEPYNGHLSIIILGIYRSFAVIFGFVYTPTRVVGALSFFAIPMAFFLTTRRQFGVVLAAFLATPLAWYGRYISLNPSELNHYLALLGGIGCAAALNRGRRADRVLAAALAFSLCSAGGGVAVAAACVVHNACTRPSLRRWLAVICPSALWAVWWLVEAGRPADLGPFAMTTSQTIRYVRDLSYTPFQSLALGFTPLAVALMIAFVAYAVWALSKGLRSGANVVAWSVAFVVWAVGLASSRGTLVNVTTFRYRYVALGFVLLAVVPKRPIVWPACFPINVDRRWLNVAAVAILLLGTARALAVRSDMQDAAQLPAASGRMTRGETLVLELGPSVIPDGTVLPFALGGLRAADVRALLRKYGAPFPAVRATADQQLVDMKAVHARLDGPRHGDCTALDAPFTYRPSGSTQQYLWSSEGSFVVDIRRFGTRWVRVAQAPRGTALAIVLPSLGADQPWQIRADGACRVGARKN